MLARFLSRAKYVPSADLLSSRLFNEQTFYAQFRRDLKRAKKEIVIESPFLTSKRVQSLRPTLCKAMRRGVSVIVNTRDPEEHEDYLRLEAVWAVSVLKDMGVKVLFTGRHHRKLAILDRRILFEGSLNILSQNDSCEVMRRIDSEAMARQMIDFVQLKKFL